jgi:hypothetical protein
MTALVLSALPNIVAGQIHATLPALATCTGIVGRLDMEEVAAKGWKTPAVLVSRLRLDQQNALAGPLYTYRATMAAFVLTKDELGLPRDEAACAIAQAILQLLPDARFARADIGPAERIAEEPIVTPAIRKAGVALSAVTWEQDITLQPLPEATPITPDLYVTAHIFGQAQGTTQITGDAP